MKVYTLKQEQFIPISLKRAWEFFSSPGNLKEITPKHMGFEIISGTPEKMYPGQVIQYIVRPVLGIPMHWMTEIKHVSEPYYFVDEQRNGPYKMWYHQHWIEEVEGGVIMKDQVNYALPLGILGRFAHWLFVKKKLEGIFSHRKEILDKYFQNQDSETVVMKFA